MSETEYIKDAMEMIGLEIDAPKQIVQELSGFTPIFDAVVKHYGDETRAAVHGAIWRYCQMSDGVCRASLDTIAKSIGVDKATVQRHAEQLVADGYFKDLTPDLRHRPHIYADTGRVVMKSSLNAGVAERKPSVAQSKPTVAQRNTGVAESQLSKDSIKDSNKHTGADAPADEKPDLVDGLIQFAQSPAMKKEHRLDAIASQIKTTLGREPSGRAGQDFTRFVDERQQKHGETLTDFLRWLTSQPRFDLNYWTWQRMREDWGRAFIEPSKRAASYFPNMDVRV